MLDLCSITSKNIDLYGSKVTLEIDNVKYKTKAFVQPLRYKNKMYVDGYFLAQGYLDGGHYLYIGKADFKFTDPIENNIITLDNSLIQFIVKRFEVFQICDKDIYIWAIITPLHNLEEVNNIEK